MRRLSDAEHDGKNYAQNMSIAELRQLPPEKLPAGPGFGRSWPVIDGWVIPDDQHKLYEASRFNDVPVLIGYNSDEGAQFLPPKTPEEYIVGVKNRYGKFADALIQAYPVSSNSVPKTARDLMRDTAFGWQTWSWTRLQSQNGKRKVFYYYFDQHPEGAEGSGMAWMCHSCSSISILTAPNRIWKFQMPWRLTG